MLGIFIFAVFVTIILIIAKRGGELTEVSERRWEKRVDYLDNYMPDKSKPKVKLQRPRNSKKPVSNSQDVVTFEGDHCEICPEIPKKQYTNFNTFSVLEFCGHHSIEHEGKLLTNNYELTLPLKDLK